MLDEMTDNSNDIVDDDLYLRNQQHCWPSHAAHFHTTFTAYKNCPQTCPEEIEEFINKVRTQTKQRSTNGQKT